MIGGHTITLVGGAKPLQTTPHQGRTTPPLVVARLQVCAMARIVPLFALRIQRLDGELKALVRSHFAAVRLVKIPSRFANESLFAILGIRME